MCIPPYPTTVHADSSITVNVYPTNLSGSGGWVKVTWSYVDDPSDSDWIGVYSPPTDDYYKIDPSEHAPIKLKVQYSLYPVGILVCSCNSFFPSRYNLRWLITPLPTWQVEGGICSSKFWTWGLPLSLVSFKEVGWAIISACRGRVGGGWGGEANEAVIGGLRPIVMFVTMGSYYSQGGTECCVDSESSVLKLVNTAVPDEVQHGITCVLEFGSGWVPAACYKVVGVRQHLPWHILPPSLTSLYRLWWAYAGSCKWQCLLQQLRHTSPGTFGLVRRPDRDDVCPLAKHIFPVGAQMPFQSLFWHLANQMYCALMHYVCSSNFTDVTARKKEPVS